MPALSPRATEAIDSQARSLRSGFLRAAERFGDRPALEVEGEVLSYEALRSRAASLAATLQAATPAGGTELTAVLGQRSATAFTGVLAALLRGHGYVPLNPRFPAQRSNAMLLRAGCRALVVDAGSAALLDEVIADAPSPMLIVAPELEDVRAIAERWPEHRVLGARDLEPPDRWSPEPVDPGAIAYLLFTSGSTGQPKGVMVAHRNALAVVDAMVERYGISEHDRCSQTFDLTFDLSVFDMFVAWERGACLCCPTAKQLIKPGRFIRESRLTLWFCVPSVAVFMRRLGMLKPGSYPDLRWSLFCGEPLPVEVARAWSEAAPASTVENLYGPTELTIACTLYRWRGEASMPESELGVVPIGHPFPDMTWRVCDPQLQEVEPGHEGELLLCGPQVTPGYWQDPERTAAAFVVPPGRSERHYRTGDRVRRPIGDAPMVYLGRMDHQVKIRGHRVELGEIEAALREESGVDAAIAVAWPVSPSGADGVVAFLGDTTVDAADVKARLARRLPDYMVPRAIHLVAEMPLNANGKFDRRALLARLEEGHELAVA